MPILDLTNRKPEEELNKLPKPTNENLLKLFAGVDRIVIKGDGVYEDKAISSNVVLTITQSDDIQKFQVLMKIDEKNTGFYCLCLGSYAIELHNKSQINATIGLHHGWSIRYEYWRGDAALDQSEPLLIFLSELGLSKPLEDRIKENEAAEADRKIERKWLEIAPKCFSKYWSKMNDLSEDYFPSLIADLNEEIPDKEEQIQILLHTFGKTNFFWTAYPIYENVPYEILKTFEVNEIISAYLNSKRNYLKRKGLGRFLCFFDLKKIRKKYLHLITNEILDDIENCFKNFNEKRGIEEIKLLREQILEL